jgi:hypothetical protein
LKFEPQIRISDPGVQMRCHGQTGFAGHVKIKYAI